MFGLWFVVCGLWFVVCGLWFVVCGLWFVVCGLWFVVCVIFAGFKLRQSTVARMMNKGPLLQYVRHIKSKVSQTVVGLTYSHNLIKSWRSWL